MIMSSNFDCWLMMQDIFEQAFSGAAYARAAVFVSAGRLPKLHARGDTSGLLASKDGVAVQSSVSR